MKSIMFDIETLGTSSNSVILSIAAVKFDFTSDSIDTFSMNIDPKSCKSYGMITNPSTVEWWKQQPADAIKAFMTEQHPIDVALNGFNNFVGSNWKNTIFYCNGASFDYPIMQWSYDAVGIEAPWKYWNQRDARTIYSVFGLDLRDFPRVGTHHNAIDDCLTQIAALKQCLS